MSPPWRISRESPATVERASAEAVEARVLAVLRSGRWIGGPVVAEAERALADLFGMAHGVGVNSGTDALVLALMACGVGPGDDVIVPAVSFFATASAVVLVGARPVIVDVLPDRPLLDPAAVRQAWSPRVKAVVPVHLFGMAAPHIAGLPDYALVVDDLAQAAGAQTPVGQGPIAALSLYPTKVLAGAGDGGAVLTDSAELAERVRALGSHGLGPEGAVRVQGHVGRNSRLDALQAAVVLGRLPDLARRLEHRRVLAMRYQDALGAKVLVPGRGRPVSVLCLRSRQRDVLRARLLAAGIEATIYYPRPLHHEPALDGLARTGPCPNAERFCAEALALPCHAGMSLDDVDDVIAVIQDTP